MDYLELAKQKLTELAVAYGPRVLLAIVVLIVGSWLVKRLTKAVERSLEKRKVEHSLKPFLKGLIGALLRTMLYLSVISMLGVAATSFIAVLGAAGLAIGMALSGTLQNFAGGVVILLLKPFKVGEVIEAQGYTGTVTEIQVFHTIVTSFDNKTYILPNGSLSTSALTNLSREENRRAEWTFGVAYGTETNTAREVIRKALQEEPRILNDPEPFIAVKALNDSSVDFVVRAWTKAADLWPVYFDLNETMYNRFNAAGIGIPYPTMEVNVQQIGQQNQ